MARSDVHDDGGKTLASWDRMNGKDKTLTLDRFESLLDAYGGELSRWPDGLGHAAVALIETSDQARALYAEAEALERLLAKGSMPEPEPERIALLASRIVAAGSDVSTKLQSDVGAGARIIRLPSGRRSGAGRPSDADLQPRIAASLAPRRSEAPWRTMAALAASLAFGVVIGLSDLVPAAVVNVGSFIDAGSDSEIVLSGLQLDGLSVLDEDQI